MAEPVDVTRRVRSIGEFFLMQPEQTYGHETRYDSSHRNIAIFDEDVDAFVEITLRDAVSNDEYFETDDDGHPKLKKPLSRTFVSPGKVAAAWRKTPNESRSPEADERHDDYSDREDYDSKVALLGDLPVSDDCNDTCSQSVPLSPATTIRFASSFFTADDQTCFSRCFGREIPFVLRNMDDTQSMTTTPESTTEALLFQKLLNGMQTYILTPSDKTRYISEVQSFYAHSNNAYSLWMFTHSILWADTHDDDGGMTKGGDENDYSSALKHAYFALHRGRSMPDPPRWCDRSITILTQAIMYALLRTRPVIKQVLKLSKDICDKTGAITTPASEHSGRRQRIPYAAISCTVSSFENVATSVARWCSEEAGGFVSSSLRALLEVATFSAINIAQPLFEANPLHELSDSFFGPCVLKHKSTGNIHIDIDSVTKAKADDDDDDADKAAIGLYKIPADALVAGIDEDTDNNGVHVYDIRLDSRAQYGPGAKNVDTEMVDNLYFFHSSMKETAGAVTTGEDFEQTYMKTWGESWMRMFRACDAGCNRATTKIWSSDKGPSKVWWGLCRVYLATIDQICIAVANQQTLPIQKTLGTLRAILSVAIELNTGDIVDWKSQSFVKAASELLLACAPRLSEYFVYVFTLKSEEGEVGTSSGETDSKAPPPTTLHIEFEGNPVEMESSYLNTRLLVDILRHEASNRKTINVQSDQHLVNLVLLVSGGSRFHLTISETMAANLRDSFEKLPLDASSVSVDDAKILRTPFRAPSGLKRDDGASIFYRLRPVDDRFDTDKGLFYHYIHEMRKGRPNLDEMKRKFKTIDDFRDFLVKAALQNCTPSDEVSVHAPLGYSGGVSIMDRVDRRRARMRATSSGDDDTRTTAPCSEAIAERVKQAEKRLATRPHELAIFVMFVTMEFSRKTLTAIIDCNKMFPFGYLLLRPYQTYQMCAAILTKSGKETGETLIGHYDFQLSDDVVRKMHYGNFTIYQKAVVYNPKNVLPVPDIWCQGYLGGGTYDDAASFVYLLSFAT
ncbi:hypothetical protein CYMTET_47149 [Cymbomonas tetramitiformis]|uniref:Uncharacterized protein n=1 Tax=Cymbomonas tetramitiformis TaxID=36881 RepID=A0AAE0BUQ1_9CHLO|nr:hypothetical protein CYMTET_47149 [Cymbomonas tetramitiformis]